MTITSISLSRNPKYYEDPICADAEAQSIQFFLPDEDETGIRVDERQYRAAKQLCNGCLHKIECGQWAIENEFYGVWGGLTPRERATLRRKFKITIAS